MILSCFFLTSAVFRKYLTLCSSQNIEFVSYFPLSVKYCKNLPEEMFPADIKEKKYVSNILKSVPRGGEIDIVYNETISRFVNLTCKKTFFSLINVWKKKTTHFLNAFHLRQDSSVDIIESRNSSVCCIEFIKWTVRNYTRSQGHLGRGRVFH